MIIIDLDFVRTFSSEEQLIMIRLLLNADDMGKVPFCERRLSRETGISYQKVRTIHQRLLRDKIIYNAEGDSVTIYNYDSYKRLTEIKTHTTNSIIIQPKQKVTIDYESFGKFFNDVMAGKAIKPITAITDKRKGNLNARLREHGREALAKVVRNAADSEFLNGNNNRGWVATFDWLFLPSNFTKVLEGNYNNREQHDQRTDDVLRRQAGAAAIIARLAEEEGDDNQ